MAIGIYIAFNPPAPDIWLSSDGKLLGTHLETLERLAELVGVPSLSSFMDQRIPEPECDEVMVT